MANWRELVSGYGQQIMQQPGRYSAIRENFGTIVRAAMQLGMTRKAEERKEAAGVRGLGREEASKMRLAEFGETLPTAVAERGLLEAKTEALGEEGIVPHGAEIVSGTLPTGERWEMPETPSDWNLWKQAEDEVYRQLGGSAWMGLPSRREEYYPQIERRYKELKAAFTRQLPIGEVVPPDIVAEYPTAYRGEDGNWYVDREGKTYRIRRTP